MVVKDELTLFNRVHQQYPSLPYFIIGHSMGTMMLQRLLPLISGQIAGAVLIGISAPHPELTAAWPIISSLNRLAPTKKGKLLDAMAFGSFSKPFNRHIKFSWLTHDPKILSEYTEDPQSGFVFTNNGFYTLFSLTKEVTRSDWWHGIRSDLPILITSGTHDPVGKFGKGPKYHFDLLNQAGFSRTILQMWQNDRHEILNEVNRHSVYQYIDSWMQQNVVK